MKKLQKYVLLVFGTVVFSCSGHQITTMEKMAELKMPLPPYLQERQDVFVEKFNKLENEKLDASIYYFQELVEWALTLRAKTTASSELFVLQKKLGKPFNAQQLDGIRKGIQEHLALRGSIYELVSSYVPWMYEEENQNPLLNREVRSKGILFALAGAVVLYDNFAFSVIHFQNNDDLRKLVNSPDKGYKISKDQLFEVFKDFTSPSNRRRVRRAQLYLKENSNTLQQLIDTDDQVAWLSALVRQSPSSADIKEDSSFKAYARMVGLFSTSSFDNVKHVGRESMNAGSQFFGNTVGLIQTRHGKLHNDVDCIKAFKSKLKPLDILLEKTPFRLTDKLIPGYFGHVAIWVGTEEELKAEGLWDHEIVKPHQEDIRKGASVLEALRDGVQLNTMAHFIDVDDACVLRLKNIENRKETLIRAFRQLGKSYDFNFNVETTDRIVCSELAYVVYTDFDWRTEKTLGRSTISPDNVAMKAIDGVEMDLILFYHDGKDLKDKAYAVYCEKLKAVLDK